MCLDLLFINEKDNFRGCLRLRLTHISIVNVVESKGVGVGLLHILREFRVAKDRANELFSL